MPEQLAPPVISPVSLDTEPLRLLPSAMADQYALTVCRNTFWQFLAWRQNNIDPRWSYNERLFFGAVEQRYWEGTKIKRSSVPVMKVFQAVDASYATIGQELFGSDDMIRVVPETGTDPKVSQIITNRLQYILDHNIDDYGWSAVMEYKQALLDQLVYGNCYGMVEYDYARRQPIIWRVDPRDVWIDPACTSPYVERSRHSIVRRMVTIQDVEGWRGAPGFNIPASAVLYWLAKNKTAYNTQGAERLAWDQMVADPAGQFLNLFIHMFSGREVWTLDNQVVIFNEVQPYKCTRLVSAPCKFAPNRHYSLAIADLVDGTQQAETSILNLHIDELSLALAPPKTVQTGSTRTPGALSARPNAIWETNDTKAGIVVNNPLGMSANVFQDLAFLSNEADMTVGLSPLAKAGMPQASNANRTAGGMQMQLSGSNSRLVPIAENFEKFFMIPSFYKMLKVDATHSREGRRGY